MNDNEKTKCTCNKKVAIKMVNTSKLQAPTYATPGSSGMDLRAVLSNDYLTIGPFTHVLVKTGIHIELPVGYEAQVRPRSGLALKQGLTVLNTPGTIDADYRGEIGVILYNSSPSEQTITNGDKIAQLVIAKVEQPSIQMCESLSDLSDTERGSGGFGSTGKA